VINIAAAWGVEPFGRFLRARQQIAVVLVTELTVQPGQQDQSLFELFES